MDKTTRIAATMLFAFICALPVAAALVRTYFFEGGPITVAGYTFRRGASDAQTMLGELEFGLLPVNIQPQENCLSTAQRFAKTNAKTLVVKGESVLAVQGVTRYVIRCLASEKIAIVYGASSDFNELEQILRTATSAVSGK